VADNRAHGPISDRGDRKSRWL